MFSSNEQSKNITIILSVLISFLAVAIITYAATTISTNINTGGILTVSGNATSTFGTGGLTVGSSQFVVQQTSGNVGIGTTGPGVKLHIFDTTTSNSKLLLETSSTGDGAAVSIDFTTPGSSGSISMYSDTFSPYPHLADKMLLETQITSAGIALMTKGDGKIDFYTGGIGAGNHRMVITSTGNVGIGTTTPNWLLQAAGTRPSFALSDTSAAANNKHWLLSSMGGNLYVGTSTDAYATSTPPALTILNNGNVGIGTTTPGFLLTLADGNNLRLGGGGNIKFEPQSPSTMSYLAKSNNDSNFLFYRYDSDSTNRYFNIQQASNGGWLGLLVQGRVGIGTTTPTTMFQVATSTANATTTVEFGKTGQNKGSCLKMYNSAGTLTYCQIDGTTFSCSTTSCE